LDRLRQAKTIMGSLAVSVWSITMQLTYLSENIFFPRCRRKQSHIFKASDCRYFSFYYDDLKLKVIEYYWWLFETN